MAGGGGAILRCAQFCEAALGDVRRAKAKMLERHFVAASNVPHAYHPLLAKHAVAYAFASKMTPQHISELIATTDPALNIDARTMRHIVYHTVAARLDPDHYAIADDMVPDEWGDMQYAPADSYDASYDVPMEDLQHNLQQALFTRRAGIAPDEYSNEGDSASVAPGTLDPARRAHMEQLLRHGNIEEAIRADDEPSEDYYQEPSYGTPDGDLPPIPTEEHVYYNADNMPPPMFEELGIYDNPTPTPTPSVDDSAARSLNDDLASVASAGVTPGELAKEESALHEVYDVNPVATPNALATFAEASEASLVTETVVQTPAAPTEEEKKLEETITTSEETIAKNEEKKKELEAEIAEKRAEEERIAQETARKEHELIEKEKAEHADLAALKAKEAELKKEEKAVAAEKDSPAKAEKLKTLTKARAAAASDAAAKEREIRDTEDKRKRNAERADKAAKGFQKFLKRTRKEANAIDKETGFSQRAKEEATAKLNQTVDRGFDKASEKFDKGLDRGFDRLTKMVDRKINTPKVTDAVIAEAAKTDPAWRDITADDRKRLAEETDRQTESLVAMVNDKEARDVATVDDLTASKQIKPRTADRIKRLLTAQNTAALNVAIKSFAHNAGAKLGLTSKKFSALLKELEKKGGAFSKELAVKLREYAPIVKETLGELTKGAGTLTREVGHQLAPIVKEWAPIIMEQVNNAGSMALTEVIKQIPNLTAMVVQIVSKSGKSAIGADMDAAPARLLHSQWKNGSVAYEELVPTDPDDGIFAFPENLDAADVLHHAVDMARDTAKSSIFWMLYLRMYFYVSQMCRERDDWFAWSTERAALMLGANPVVLSTSDAPVPASTVEWVHHYTGVPYTAHNEDALRTFVELVMRGCVSLSEDCRMHARILMRTPAAGIGFDNLSLL